MRETSTGTTYSVDNLSWAKRNVFALIIAAGLPSTQVEAIASSQDAIPSSGVKLSDGGAGLAVIGGVFIAIVIALIVGVPVGLLVRSRRRKPVPGFAASNWTIAPGDDWSVPSSPASPAPSVTAWGTPVPAAAPAPAQPTQPGWQPVAGDQYRQAYWDGSRWTAQKRWDGTNWIDV